MEPELSIVVTSRNDNHGGDMNSRMTLFVKSLIKQTNKFKLASELVFVEWNPPENRPLLNKILPTPQKGDFLKIKYVIVPNHLHRKYKYSEYIPLYQMIAKNVGIKRSKASLILCTNVDILFLIP